MKPSKHISLVGLSGSGKSSVAPVLAGLTHRTAVDLDRKVAQDSGRSVDQLFADEGEEYFRELETQALRSVLSGPPCVIATGGGIVTTPGSANLLAAESVVVWLRAGTEVLLERLEADEPRPLLAGDPAARLMEMAEQRGPLYQSLAEVVIDVDDLGIDEIADRVASATSVAS